jgi:DNA-binding GntR family transcriptional regulator
VRALSVEIMKWEPDVPRWRQVYAVLRERIVDGTYAPEEQLPSVVAICGEFGISQMTARRVLTELRKEGLAYMQPGLGTFVTDLPQPPTS